MQACIDAARDAVDRAIHNVLLSRSRVLFVVSRSCGTDAVVYEYSRRALHDYRAGGGAEALGRLVRLRWVLDGGAVVADVPWLKRKLLEVAVLEGEDGVLRVALRPPGLRNLDCRVGFDAADRPRVVAVLDGVPAHLTHAWVEYAPILPVPLGGILFGCAERDGAPKEQRFSVL